MNIIFKSNYFTENAYYWNKLIQNTIMYSLASQLSNVFGVYWHLTLIQWLNHNGHKTLTMQFHEFLIQCILVALCSLLSVMINHVEAEYIR